MVEIPFKRGDTLLLQNSVSIDTVAQNITDWTITAKVRNSGLNFSDTLLITKTEPLNGKYQLRKDDTKDWPAKPLLCDVEMVLPSGQIISTETFSIIVHPDVTY